MQRERLPNAMAAVTGATKAQLLAAVVSPSRENAAHLRVVWLRPPFQSRARPVAVDVRLLRLQLCAAPDPQAEESHADR